ncbi:hypothetical protein SAMN04487894_10932 [Niabella drilacis]|uniref:Uncharacterized protein n=2 Tax=Niabella drilacis (strain DSM 25811 / CCM 8410 / CCUG 62505 / LMG 26954 / E90) TaxID=1285928 RepID=A0A1G6UMF9_NIADE|nr:hypothetical protein SAMN04487894_10932 [Niabella drilacis]
MDHFMKGAGFTIRELAVILGFSHSLTGHHLKGNRSLPTDAFLRFAQLRSDWLAFCKSNRKEAVPVTAARRGIKQQVAVFLENEASAASFEVARLSRLLEQQQKRYQVLEAKLRFILLPGKRYTDEGRSLFLKIRENELLQSMEYCCPEKQEIVRYRLALVKQREQVARKASASIRKDN